MKISSIDQIIERHCDDKEFIIEIFSLFYKQWSLDIVAITNALAANDIRSLKITFHKIKGALLSLGANVEADVIEQAEDALRDADLGKTASLFDDLKERLSLLEEKVALLKRC